MGVRFSQLLAGCFFFSQLRMLLVTFAVSSTYVLFYGWDFFKP
jgi:hypothetical protein